MPRLVKTLLLLAAAAVLALMPQAAMATSGAHFFSATGSVANSGALQVSNFDGYTPMRMSQMPDLDISIIANNDPPSGCGEPGVTVVAPAIANAIFNAVGARVRSLPITADAVKAAMKA